LVRDPREVSCRGPEWSGKDVIDGDRRELHTTDRDGDLLAGFEILTRAVTVLARPRVDLDLAVDQVDPIRIYDCTYPMNLLLI
jgi:hypothetical protein